MKKLSEAFYAGSFDPITNGHLEVIKSALEFVDILNIIVPWNINKADGFLSSSVRIELIREVMVDEGIDHSVAVFRSEVLLADHIASYHPASSKTLIRGLRNTIDFTQELQMASINKDLGMNTIFIPSLSTAAISSSAVRELWHFNKDLTKYVPQAVAKFLKETGERKNDS